MKLICERCGYLYDVAPSNDGRTDPLCSSERPGILRAPTPTELVLLARYAALHEVFGDQAREIARMRATQGSLL